MFEDPQNTKDIDDMTALLGSSHVKAEYQHGSEIDTRGRLHQHFLRAFYARRAKRTRKNTFG